MSIPLATLMPRGSDWRYQYHARTQHHLGYRSVQAGFRALAALTGRAVGHSGEMTVMIRPDAIPAQSGTKH